MEQVVVEMESQPTCPPEVGHVSTPTELAPNCSRWLLFYIILISYNINICLTLYYNIWFDCIYCSVFTLSASQMELALLVVLCRRGKNDKEKLDCFTNLYFSVVLLLCQETFVIYVKSCFGKTQREKYVHFVKRISMPAVVWIWLNVQVLLCNHLKCIVIVL